MQNEYHSNPRPNAPRAVQNPARRPVRQPAGIPRQPAAGAPGRAPARQPSQSSPRGGRWFRAIIMVIATLVACFFFAFFILQSASDLFGLNQEDMQIEVTVPKNVTLQKLSTLLYDKGVISQTLTFRLYAGLKTEDGDINPGNYIFNSNMSYDQIISSLKTANTQKQEVVVTFIEGWTLYEMAVKLEENKVCDAEEFLDYMNNGDIDYEFMNQIPSDPLRYRRLEGYAFPDTYYFYEGMDVKLVADKFLYNFDSKITDDLRAKMRERNLSIDETIVLASIIQKEATPQEMGMVSSVFHNRLSVKETYPQLQSDVTIYYVDKFIKPFQNSQNQAMYDAYNTYKCDGLPVGAICNPGLEAIEAALEPEKSDYYFFVTDSEGVYYYAQNAQKHYSNVAKAEKVGEGEIHGTDTLNE